jgi:LuxR family transcriptional regulator, glucitol operon activator
VITIVGEGGIGKTALALRIAYETLDASPPLYDAVVWTTAKTTMLTPKQIVQIEGAICDSLGMLRVASDALAGSVTGGDAIDELLEYLASFRILLILDNLETVLDERLRGFLGRLPQGSKVLITSRVGVGAFEYPLKLDPLSNTEAVQLLRALTKARGLSKLLAVSNQIVAGYCEQMKNNPGYIKWFVSAVHAGARPEEVLSDPALFLDFCMSNIYTFLSDDSRRVLQTLQYLSGSRSQAELAFLSELDSERLQRGLQQLLTTNMVNMVPVAKGTSFQSTYDLSELAREYLARRHPVASELANALKNRRRELVRASGEIAAGRRADPYSLRTIQVRSPSDHIVAKYLSDAMSAVNRSAYTDAEQLIREAKRLAPEFYEVHRVEAFLRIAEDNFTAATTCYEAALELKPNAASLHLAFAGFLIRYLDDPESASSYLKRAYELDPQAVAIQSELVVLYLSLGSYDDAERIIRELLTRVISSERTQKKIFDLMLQLYQRKAERAAAQGDYMRALDILENLKNAFEGVPKNMVDRKMLQKLIRARGIARICRRNVSDHQMRQGAANLEAWLVATANDSPIRVSDSSEEMNGQIVRWISDRRFGFITGEDDKDYFFHFSAIISQHNPQDVNPGMRVIFNPIKRSQGRPSVERRDHRAGSVAHKQH